MAKGRTIPTGIDIDALGALIESVPFQIELGGQQLGGVLRYRWAEVDKERVAIVRPDENGKEVVVRFEEVKPGDPSERDLAEGESQRFLRVDEWLTFVLTDDGFPMASGGSPMTPQEVYERYHNMRRILVMMREAIQEHHNPFLKVLKQQQLNAIAGGS